MLNENFQKSQEFPSGGVEKTYFNIYFIDSA